MTVNGLDTSRDQLPEDFDPSSRTLSLPPMNTNELQENVVASRHLIRRPKALQWFHNGELKKASDEERQAGRFELFLDLLCTL